jgi:hypothetical protein
MGPFVSGFRTSLSEQGYSVLAVGNMLTYLGALGRWMQEHEVQPGQLSPAVIAELPPRLRLNARRRALRLASPMPAALRERRRSRVLGPLWMLDRG